MSLKYTCDASVNPGSLIHYICGTKSRGGKLIKSQYYKDQQQIINALKAMLERKSQSSQLSSQLKSQLKSQQQTINALKAMVEKKPQSQDTLQDLKNKLQKESATQRELRANLEKLQTQLSTYDEASQVKNRDRIINKLLEDKQTIENKLKSISSVL